VKCDWVWECGVFIWEKMCCFDNKMVVITTFPTNQPTNKSSVQSPKEGRKEASKKASKKPTNHVME
jgi:hypothetical protein